MKFSKKILITMLSLSCIGVSAAGVAACKKNTAVTVTEIVTLTPDVVYRVGDNLYLYDLFEEQKGVDFTFTVSVNGAEAEEVEGDSYYLKKAGTYTVVCTAGKKSKNVEIRVYDQLPYMMLQNTEAEVVWNTSMLPSQIISGLATAKTISEAQFDVYLENVVVYNDAAGEATTYELEHGVSVGDGLWDGSKFTFIYECDYLFTIVCETSGGAVREQLRVSAREDYSVFPELTDYVISYDSQTRTVTWDEVDGAVGYRVKVDRAHVTTENTTLNIDEYCVREFQFFDLVVIPKNAGGKEFGKLVVKDVVIAPEGLEGLVLGNGSNVDVDTKTVTLAGKEAYTAAASDISKLENSHVAFGGSYGIGTYVDFTFTGNNMPNVMFFADAINGDMTKNGGSGYILMNGLYSQNKGTSVSKTPIIGENRMVCIGPDRLHPGDRNDPLHNYIIPSEQANDWLVSENTLFTQKYLNDDTSGRTYRYVVGTFDKDGYLAFECKLYDAADDTLIESAMYVTDTPVEEVEPGYIVAYATVKGAGKDTVFACSKLPYESKPDDKTLYWKGVTENVDGSVTLAGKQFVGASWTYNIANTENNYLGISGEYGIGTYIDITLKGNNMPSVMFFADKVNGYMTTDGGNGLIITNGLTSQGDWRHGWDTVFVHGLTRIKNLGSDADVRADYASTAIAKTNAYTYLTKAGLETTPDTEYKLTIGTFENAGGFVVVDIILYATATNEKIHDVQLITEISADDVEAGHIVLYDAMKGTGKDTTFKYSAPYAGEVDPIKVASQGATRNEDGSITLANSALTTSAWTYNISTNLNCNYLGLQGSYGIGTYLDITFKGNNMPHILFFADEINGNITEDGGKGVFISNGLIRSDNGQSWSPNTIFVHGPNRIAIPGRAEDSTKTDYQTAAIVKTDAYTCLTKNGLATTPDVEYKLTVGTYLEGGNLVIDILLYNVTESETVYEVALSTSLTQNDVTAGNIILYDAVKGKDTSTTFAYSAPYTKQVG